MKITKATIKRINAHSNFKKPTYNERIAIIANIFCLSDVIVCDGSWPYMLNEGDPLNKPVIYSDGNREFVSSQTDGEYEKKIVRGLSIRYPNWISGTFTHGLNGVDIYDVNKLVKAVFDN